MKILLSGKKGKFLQKIAGAFPPRGHLQATVMPVSAQVLEAVRSAAFDAVVFVLANEDETELVRWLRTGNPSVPIVAILPRENAKVRQELWMESVSSIVSIRGLTLVQIRRKLGETLRALGKKQDSSHASSQRCISDLHTLRSALTAIQGNAELALQDSSPSESARKQMRDVVRGVTETERILRRLERNLKLLGMLPE